MTFIDVTLHEGHSSEIKERIMMRLTQVMIEELGARPHQVWVVLRQINPVDHAVGGKPA